LARPSSKPGSPAPNGELLAPGWFPMPRSLLEAYGDRLGAYGLAVLWALMTHANKNGECWPSIDRIAALIRISRRKVIATLRLLQDIGLISIQERAGESNVYQLLPAVLGKYWHAPYARGGAPGAPQACTPCPDGVHDVQGGDAPGAPEQQSGNNNEEQQSWNDPPDDWEPDLKRFWRAYPKKANDLLLAREWRVLKMTPDFSTDEIMAGLERWKKSAQWTDRTFIPDPHNFLRRRRWREHPAPGERHERTKFKHRPERSPGADEAPVVFT